MRKRRLKLSQKRNLILGKLYGRLKKKVSFVYPQIRLYHWLMSAWYFWNTTTGEVTWTNPLPVAATQPPAPPLPSGPAPEVLSHPQPPLPAQRRFGVVPEIDPALAFLLPPEARGGPSDPTAQSAMFNARTGRFTANDYMYNVEHLDEYNRMKRMNNQYFDQDAWERDMAEHNAKRKRDEEAGIVKPHSKKDMVSVTLWTRHADFSGAIQEEEAGEENAGAGLVEGLRMNKLSWSIAYKTINPRVMSAM